MRSKYNFYSFVMVKSHHLTPFQRNGMKYFEVSILVLSRSMRLAHTGHGLGRVCRHLYQCIEPVWHP